MAVGSTLGVVRSTLGASMVLGFQDPPPLPPIPIPVPLAQGVYGLSPQSTLLTKADLDSKTLSRKVAREFRRRGKL